MPIQDSFNTRFGNPVRAVENIAGTLSPASIEAVTPAVRDFYEARVRSLEPFDALDLNKEQVAFICDVLLPICGRYIFWTTDSSGTQISRPLKTEVNETGRHLIIEGFRAESSLRITWSSTSTAECPFVVLDDTARSNTLTMPKGVELGLENTSGA